MAYYLYASNTSKRVIEVLSQIEMSVRNSSITGMLRSVAKTVVHQEKVAQLKIEHQSDPKSGGIKNIQD